MLMNRFRTPIAMASQWCCRTGNGCTEEPMQPSTEIKAAG
jgi:hypothetical protein